MVLKKKVMIKNKQGLHARPAAIFVQIANKYDCNITVKKGRQKVNGKSIMGIMMLAASCGSTVNIIAEGDDAPEAIMELTELLTQQNGVRRGST